MKTLQALFAQASLALQDADARLFARNTRHHRAQRKAAREAFMAAYRDLSGGPL